MFKAFYRQQLLICQLLILKCEVDCSLTSRGINRWRKYGISYDTLNDIIGIRGNISILLSLCSYVEREFPMFLLPEISSQLILSPLEKSGANVEMKNPLWRTVHCTPRPTGPVSVSVDPIMTRAVINTVVRKHDWSMTIYWVIEGVTKINSESYFHQRDNAIVEYME